MGIPAARWCAESRSNDVNPKGFFEPRPLVWENERLLNWLDSAWMHPPANASGIDWSALSLANGRRSERVLSRSARSAPWFWKDPRLCLLMPYWEVLGVTFRDVILVTRNPADVSRSLQTRNGMTELHSLDLWYLYMMTAVKHCEGREVFILDFDSLVGRPRESAEELRSWMTLRGWAVGDSGLGEAIDPGLRRSAGPVGSLGHPAHDLYEELRSLGRGGIVLDRPKTAGDPGLILRVHTLRDAARTNWERGQRLDSRLLRSVRRAVRILPGATREIARK